LLCSLADAQSPDRTPPPSGVTVGIVEAVIGSGDLVPARFARILALSTEKAAVLKPLLQSFSDAVEEARAKARNDPQKRLAELECVKGLIQLLPGLVATERVPGTVATDADETGEFKLKGLLNQTYTVFATGRVGMNAGLWWQDLTPSEQPDRLKLTKPRIACYDPDAFFKL
jgi:hypothetical protein